MAGLLEQQVGAKFSYWHVCGGLVKSKPLMQSQSDMSKVKICVSRHIEATAAGAAMMAGLGSKIWKNWQTVSKLMNCASVFKPKRIERGQAFLVQYERALERAKNWL